MQIALRKDRTSKGCLLLVLRTFFYSVNSKLGVERKHSDEHSLTMQHFL